MFESDDWAFEDAFNDIDEKTIQSHFQSQNEEKRPSVKRRKMDSCKASSSSVNDAFDSELDIIADTEDNDSASNNKSNVSRGDLLLEIFQENTSRETFNFAKEISEDPSGVQKEVQCFQSSKMNTISDVVQYKESKRKNHVKSMNKVEYGKKVKLIRIFPGPAGLVPDVKNNDNISVMSYLNSVKELENKTATKRIEIKSQDERNLFGEKAWELLLDDLPNNFLKEYRISTIKNKANASHCDSMKIRFIAGILDYIDYSHDDPFIILKDSTGSIEGTIHRDIPLNYPGILEPNVAILLHDVGLLKTTTYIVMNKYHILVSQINLLAIYSNKGRIVSTSHMENILSNISSIELVKDYCMPIPRHNLMSGLDKNNENTILQTSSSIKASTSDYESKLVNDPSSYQLNRKNENCKQILKKNDGNCKVTEKVFEHVDYSMDINDLDVNDAFFTIDCDFITSGQQNCFNNLSSDYFTTLQTSKIQQCKLQTQNTNHLEKTKKKSVINFQNEIKEKRLPHSLEKCDADVKISNTYHLHESCLPSYDGIAHEAYRDLNSSAKFTLPVIKRNVKNPKPLVSYFTDNKYDSDDEILSQLDVDNVLNNSKKEC